MALKIGDAENFQVKEENKRLRNLIPQIVNSLMIGGGGNRPGEDGPYRPPNPDEVPGVPPGYPHIPKMLAHGEGRGPQEKYHDEYNQPLKKAPWMHIGPDGQPMEIPWQKEQYMREHPQFFPEFQISDHRGTTNYLDSQGRDSKTGSFRGSGLSDDKLIEALKIGMQLMKV